MECFVFVKGKAIDSEQFSEFTEEEGDIQVEQPSMRGFLKIDTNYLKPFFTRKLTQKV